jgi:sulfate transport system ATP-binding protein
VRRELRRWLRELHDRAGVTTVFVTHDQEEALDLADRVAILKDGELIQLGTPNEVYENPADPFVYDFLGAACRLEAIVEEGRLIIADWETKAPEGAPQGKVDVYFRPDEVTFAPADGAGLAAEVRAVTARGHEVRIECTIEGRVFELSAHGPTLPVGVAPGLALRVKPQRSQIYPAQNA